MPRSSINNPTDRILRLLAEMDELSAAYDDLFAFAGQPSRDHLLPKPTMIAFHLEMQRQGNNYQRVRPTILKTRETMQRMRDRDQARGQVLHRGHKPVALDGPTLDDLELTKQLEEDNRLIDEMQAEKQRVIDEAIAGQGPALIKTGDKELKPQSAYLPQRKETK